MRIIKFRSYLNMPRKLFLNDTEIKFCWAYLSNGFNAYQAGIQLGWSEERSKKQSYRFTQRPLVQQYIKEKVKGMEDEIKRRREEIFNGLMHGFKVSIPLQEKIIPPDQVKAGIACADTIIKMDGGYAPTKTETAVSGDLSLQDVTEVMKKNERPY